MRSVTLVAIAAGALAALAADPAAAQTARPDAASPDAVGGMTAKTVDPIHPFGAINVYNVGLEPAQVSAWAKTLDAGQKQEMIARCAVIVQNQQNYFAETTGFCQTIAIAVAQSVSGADATGR